MAATRTVINNMIGGDAFRQNFIRLLQDNRHIEVPFSRLSPTEQQTILEELSLIEAFNTARRRPNPPEVLFV